jgi:scyllo-inositol 2-dehydrogenase (NADP+)
MNPSATGAGPAGVAIIGYGLAGSVFHAPLIAATSGLEIRAVVTANPERQERVRADFPQARVVERADDLWAGIADIDCVVVATPNHLHAPLAISALEKGFHVVVDKPMALSTAEADLMIAAAERADRLLTVFHNRRWDNDFLLIKELLANDTLGGVYRMESRYERYRPDVRSATWRESMSSGKGGGLLLDLGSHLVDQAMTLLGRPSHVYAETILRRPGAVTDDDDFVALQFATGARAHLWMSSLTPVIGPRFRVWGRSRAVEIWGLDPQESQLRAGLRPGQAGFGQAEPSQRARLGGDGGESGSGEAVALPSGGYAEFYAGVRSAVASGSPPPVAPESARDVIAVIEAARESAARGIAVEPRLRAAGVPPR